MQNANLEFRKIKSLYFLYEVNENGTIIRNVKSKKQLKIKLDMHHSTCGYYVAFAKIKGVTTRIMMHKVVAECWLGDRPYGFEIDHIDRNAHNNHYSNLRYVTKSEQMKNRDHTNISAVGSLNLDKARRARMKPVKLVSDCEEHCFESFADCARFLENCYGGTFESYRSRLKSNRKRIKDFDVVYLNAETRHNHSKE